MFILLLREKRSTYLLIHPNTALSIVGSIVPQVFQTSFSPWAKYENKFTLSISEPLKMFVQTINSQYEQ